MTDQSAYQFLLDRDGTSQAARREPALEPDYVAIDERSLKDLLAFARAYAGELKYYDDQNQEAGDWSAFLSSDIDLDEVVAFMEDPNCAPADRKTIYERPHFALLLTFLQLIRHAQQQLNTLTRRHLDFYFQQALRMTKKAAVPDRVDVLIDLSDDTGQLELPAGTLLNAGTDGLGQDLFYRTDRNIVVSHARVERLSSIYAEKKITGIREARELYEGPTEEAFIEMLKIALGDPAPGDPLPDYTKDKAVDYGLLQDLHKLVSFVDSSLFMQFDEFRELMQLKIQRENANEEWNRINAILEKAGKNRTGNSTFKLDPANAGDFDANLVKALGDAPNFDGIREVENIYELYDRRIRQDVKDFIREKLYLSFDDFVEMMQLKVKIDSEWEYINGILQEAGRRKKQQPDFSISPFKSPAFEQNLAAALGPLDFSGFSGISNLKDYYAAFWHLENYFFMPAEDFSFMMSTAQKEESSPRERDRVYEKLADAYKKKIYAARQTELKEINKGRNKAGFEAMLRRALGKAQADADYDTLLEALKSFLKSDTYSDLETILDKKWKNITDGEWEEIYRILELAQRNRQGGEPVAQKEQWLNLYSAGDATLVGVQLGIETDKDFPRWKTFNQGQPSVSSDSAPPTEFGWALSSPVLALSQGIRTVHLTLGFSPERFHAEKITPLLPAPAGSAKKDFSPFRLQISTEKGWLEPDSVIITRGKYNALSGMDDREAAALEALDFELTFGASTAPIVAPPAEEAQLESQWPVLRVMLKQIWKPEEARETRGRYITYYQPFKELALVRTHVQVSVSGLKDFQIQNDDTVLDTKKPFEPFGTAPASGSRFYLGHPEIVSKKLDSLDCIIEWMSAPKQLAGPQGLYENYGNDALKNNTSFTARLSLIDRRLEVRLLEKAPLFESADASANHTISLPGKDSKIVYERDTEIVIGDDLKAWRRYLQWELNPPDFQHDAYPAVASRKAIELAADIANAKPGLKASEYQVNPPYTPKIKSLSLNYTSSVEVIVEHYKTGAETDRLLHIQPFGHAEIQPGLGPESGSYPLLPQYDCEGELYIGLRGLQAPQNLSLLFQMAEGSADPDLKPMPIQWSYLSGNRWISLEGGQMLLDTTRGLINSGIVEFALEPAQPNTLLPPDLYWLRAAIAQNSNSVCDTVAIHGQAVCATFVDNNNAPDHLGQPLPADSITGLAETLAEVSAIRQPYTSYGGKMREQDAMLYTRVSERLRHKGRALTLWDYERLILEQFPQIYKVKCLPADLTEFPDDPGRVRIIVIPDIRNRLPFNPFEPKASSDLIADIEAYLADKTPAFAAIKVKNAYYIPVKVRFGVRFLRGYNEGYYKQRLNEELNRFLSPWAYEDGADIVIGGKIYANSIINFIEERPYVDYVAQIKLFSSEDGRNFKLALPSPAEGYSVKTDRPDAVLVAARQHEIDIIPEAGYEAEAFTGINYMKIELDFIVAESRS